MTGDARDIETGLKSRSAARRLEAVRRSFRLPPEERRDILLHALKDSSNLVVAEAAKAMAGLSANGRYR